MKNLAELWSSLEREDPHLQLLHFQDREGSWQSETLGEYLIKVKYLTLALVKRGVKAKDTVAVLSTPCLGSMIAEFAAVLAKATVVTLKGLTEEEFIHRAQQQKIKILFVAGTEGWLKYRKYRGLFSTVVALERNYLYQGASLKHLLEIGKREDTKDPQLWRQLLDTSRAVAKTTAFEEIEEERCLIFLPVTDATHLSYSALLSGKTAFYVEDSTKLMRACRQIQPTLLAISSHFLMRFKEEIGYQMQQKRSRIGNWAIGLALSDKNDLWTKCKRFIADRAVYRGFRKIFGGEVRVILAKGRLSTEIESFFTNIGFSIFEID